MMVKRIPTILPDLTFEEVLEVTKIHSILGNLPEQNPLIRQRPFRIPHHTITKNALIGGGKIPIPGEISLAHLGVLFLDELPEFNKMAIETLRNPLEDKTVIINRVNASFCYPCNFMLVASMNPCVCGYYGTEGKKCRCSEQAIAKYVGKISGPIIDRIDIQIEVTPVKYQNLNSNFRSEKSSTIKERVNKARRLQIERYKSYHIFSNSQLSSQLIEKYCKLNKQSKNMLENAFNKLGLSARAYSKIIKVARTIADLEQKEQIETKHIAEAIQYRSLDKKYWKNK